MASEVDREYETEVENKESTRVSVISLFQDIIVRLAEQGWELLPSTGGDGTFKVVRNCPTKDLRASVTGLNNIPDDHRSMLGVEDGAKSFQAAVEKVINSLEGTSKPLNDMLNGFELAFSGLGGTFQGFNLDRYYLKRVNESPSTITVNGAEMCHKILPPTEWFDKRIQDITAEDLLLHCSGAPERELFQLWLGRTACGGRYHKVREHYDTGLDTGCRIMSILVGEANNGKSFTLGLVSEALEALGYDVAAIEASMDKGFGWDRVAGADLSILSDLSAGSVQKLVGDTTAATRLLQIVTGDKIDVDVKNARSININAKSAIGFATNDIPLEASIDPNEGMVSRVALISTVTRREMGQRMGTDEQRNLKQVWEALLEARGIKPTQGWLRTLAAWLLRLSADLYLNRSGYEYDSMGSLNKTRKVSLEEYVDALKEMAADKLECQHKYEVPNLAIRALALTTIVNKAEDDDYEMQRIQKVPWTWRVLQMMTLALKNFDLFDLEGDDFTLPSMDRSVANRMGILENVVRKQVADTSDPAKKHMDVMSFFQTDAGIGYPRKVGAYSKLWESRLNDLQWYIKDTRKLLEAGKIPEKAIRASKEWLNWVTEADL